MRMRKVCRLPAEELFCVEDAFPCNCFFRRNGLVPIPQWCAVAEILLHLNLTKWQVAGSR